MLAELEQLFDALETGRRTLLKELETLTPEQLAFRPGPDRWSVLMVVEHVVAGERAVRLSGPGGDREMAPAEADQMFALVMDILEKDTPVDVPDPAIIPSGETALALLLDRWDADRQALKEALAAVSSDNAAQPFARHPVTGSLTPVQTLELARAHFDTHHRQIRRIYPELNA